MAPSQAPRIITVIGSINVDLITRTARLPNAGETLTSSSFDIAFGGKGANQAVASARLSRRKADAGSGLTSSTSAEDISVHLIGAVSAADAFGSQAVEHLRSNAIDVSGVHLLPTPHKTGVAVIIVEEGNADGDHGATGENRILLSPGTNYELTNRMVNLPTDPLPAVLIMQLEVPVELVSHVCKLAKVKMETQVVFNAAPALPVSGDGMGKDGKACLPKDMFDGLEHLIVNEGEAAILGGVEEDVGENDYKRLAKEFVSWGVKNIVITLGSKGVFYYCTKEDAVAIEPMDEEEDEDQDYTGTIPPHKVNVVDTTAAGDTFVGAYAIQVARSQGQRFDLREACEIANWAASKTVERPGAQDAIPWLNEIGEIPPRKGRPKEKR